MHLRLVWWNCGSVSCSGILISSSKPASQIIPGYPPQCHASTASKRRCTSWTLCSPVIASAASTAARCRAVAPHQNHQMWQCWYSADVIWSETSSMHFWLPAMTAMTKDTSNCWNRFQPCSGGALKIGFRTRTSWRKSFKTVWTTSSEKSTKSLPLVPTTILWSGVEEVDAGAPCGRALLASSSPLDHWRKTKTQNAKRMLLHKTKREQNCVIHWHSIDRWFPFHFLTSSFPCGPFAWRLISRSQGFGVTWLKLSHHVTHFSNNNATSTGLHKKRAISVIQASTSCSITESSKSSPRIWALWVVRRESPSKTVGFLYHT